jgi:hypothetical protein
MACSLPSSARRRLPAWVALGIAAGLAGGCADHPETLEPPRLDLARYSAIGMVTFRASGPAGSAVNGEAATKEFLATIHSAQPGTPVLELGDEAGVVRGVGASALDPDAVRAIGERRRVEVVVVGHVTEKTSQPKVAVDTVWNRISAGADLQGDLEVRMLETGSGATVWSTTAHAQVPIGQIELGTTGVSGLRASPLEEARRALVQDLVWQATSDLRSHWVQR